MGMLLACFQAIQKTSNFRLVEFQVVMDQDIVHMEPVRNAMLSHAGSLKYETPYILFSKREADNS